MKKFVYLATTLLAIGVPIASAHAQDFGSEQTTNTNKLSYPSYQTSLTRIVGTQDNSISLPLGVNNYPDRQGKNGLYLTQSNSTKLFFSKPGKLDFGVDLSHDRQYNFANTEFSNTATDPLKGSNLSTGAFLNYRLSSNYALQSSLRYGIGNERGTQLSVGAKANKVFGRRHNLTAVFSVNWNHSVNPQKNVWGLYDWRQSQTPVLLNSKELNRTELRIGTSWNWNIDTNWSLSTGISAHHNLNSSTRNPFVTQRTPVTIFSVATYRF